MRAEQIPAYLMSGVLVGALLATCQPARGHYQGDGDWIFHDRLKDPDSKHYCCSGSECEPIKVEVVPGGIHIIESGEVWPLSRVIWRSRDNRWWRCPWTEKSPIPGLPARKLRTRCLIGPPPVT